jgi:hypothetical protein
MTPPNPLVAICASGKPGSPASVAAPHTMKTRLLRITAALGIAFAGCHKQSQSPASLPSTNAGSAMAAAPLMQSILTVWQQGDKSTAVSNFVEANWDARPLFAADSVLSLSEGQFQSQLKSSPVFGNADSKRIEMTQQLDAVKRLAAAVTQAGVDSAARKEFTQARKHFTSLKQFGEALDGTNSLAIVRMVGQGVKKRADTEFAKLPP